MRTVIRPPLPVGTYEAIDTAWRTSEQAASLIVWLNQIGIDEHAVYEVTIEPARTTIYRYKHDENGGPYMIFRHLAQQAPLTVKYS